MRGNACDFFVYPQSRSFKTTIPRWWFQRFFIFTPNPREMIQFDLSIFFSWVVQPPTRYWLPVYTCTAQEPLRLLEAASGQISKVHRERHTEGMQRLRHMFIDFCIIMILYIHNYLYNMQSHKATFAVNEQNLVGTS